MVDDTCPLEVWFQRAGESKNEFMERTGIKRRTLFDLLDGAHRDFRVGTLSTVETGTGGEVTMRMMIEWHNTKHRGK